MTKVTGTSLLISSGNGPGECSQAVAGILRRVLDEARQCGLQSDVSTVPAKDGLKSAVVVLDGEGHDPFAESWCGTIRWRAKSVLRPNHKRANWFIGVFKLATSGVSNRVITPGDVVFESFRAGGPGGQHQNTTDSAVRATHRPTGATAVARDMRSQHRNKAMALQRLQYVLDAQAFADQAMRLSDQNQLHKALERGNPVRCFQGRNFRQERCP